ncbi:MAG: hypothetical protein INR62_10835 [Rhodospirillales bacterium]|nr:hypothetical protein [Acetobacter sp.]
MQLPRIVRDLTAERSGDEVLLHFTVPAETTEGLALRGHTLTGKICRQQSRGGACVPISPAPPGGLLSVPASGAAPETVTWTDPLPPDLATGKPRLLGYRLEVRNGEGKTAGYSAPSFTAAGQAPTAVQDLRARGVRTGVLLEWAPVNGGGEVLLRRQETDRAAQVPPSLPSQSRRDPRHLVSSARSAPDRREAWLQAEPGNPSAAKTVDAGALEGVPYRYVAVRRIVPEVDGQRIELRSAPSGPVAITWTDTFPPPSPQGLTAVGFFVSPAASAAEKKNFAVDLIWRPVEDARITGYLVRRAVVRPNGEEIGTVEVLTREPVTSPAFHDSTAQAEASYRYEVVAVDAKGNISAPATFLLNASER